MKREFDINRLRLIDHTKISVIKFTAHTKTPDRITEFKLNSMIIQKKKRTNVAGTEVYRERLYRNIH